MENNQQTWNEIRNSGIAPAYKKQAIKDEIASQSLKRADKRNANNTKTTSAFTFGWQLAGTDGQAFYSQSFNATAESSGSATTDYVNFGAYVNIKHISMMCYEPSGEVINISRNSFVQMGTIKADNTFLDPNVGYTLAGPNFDANRTFTKEYLTISPLYQTNCENVRCYGLAPYRIRLEQGDGTNISWDSVDLLFNVEIDFNNISQVY